MYAGWSIRRLQYRPYSSHQVRPKANGRHGLYRSRFFEHSRIKGLRGSIRIPGHGRPLFFRLGRSFRDRNFYGKRTAFDLLFQTGQSGIERFCVQLQFRLA